MAHFYGSLTGTNKSVTRQGSRDGGIQAWVQGHHTKLYVGMSYNHTTECDDAVFTLKSGQNSYSSKTFDLHFSNVDAVFDALVGGDARAVKIWDRVQRDVKKLNEIAPAAVERIKRKAAA